MQKVRIDVKPVKHVQAFGRRIPISEAVEFCLFGVLGDEVCALLDDTGYSSDAVLAGILTRIHAVPECREAFMRSLCTMCYEHHLGDDDWWRAMDTIAQYAA